MNDYNLGKCQLYGLYILNNVIPRMDVIYFGVIDPK